MNTAQKITWRKIAGFRNDGIGYWDSCHQCIQYPKISRITVCRDGRRKTGYHVEVDEDEMLPPYRSFYEALAAMLEVESA